MATCARLGQAVLDVGSPALLLAVTAVQAAGPALSWAGGGFAVAAVATRARRRVPRAVALPAGR